VPSIVRCIYRLLKSSTDVSAEQRLDNPLLEMTHVHTADVVVTLLHRAPAYDSRGQACQETLLQATTLLKKRKLARLLKRQRTWAVGECLVPSIVRCIYRLLKSSTDVSAEQRLDNPLLELTHVHTADVVVTLLHRAPAYDRYGAHLP
ncbi:maestro heat-like repeat family member 5, partial [Grus japonensis]